MAQPAEKSGQLIAEINSMIYLPRNEERIRAIEHEISLIEKSGFYYQAKMLQGMIAGLHGDADGVRCKFRAALGASGNDSLVRINYANALSNLYLFSEAGLQIDLAVEVEQDDPDTLLCALDIHQKAFNFERCDELIEQIARLGLFEKIPERTLNKMKSLRPEQVETGANSVDICERIACAAAVIHDLGLYIFSAIETDVDGYVLMEFSVSGNIELAAHAESAIHLEISSRPYSPADKFISFACAPYECQCS